MKGLYYQVTTSQDEEKFVFLEKEHVSPPSDYHVKLQVKACALSPVNAKLISKLYPEKEFLAVGREVAGVILEVGSKVSFFQPDDGAVVHKSEKVSWVEAAGTVRDGLCVYTALHSLAQLAPGKSVLVLDGASPFGTLAVQLSHQRGATVIATAHSEEDKQYLDKLRPTVGVRQPVVARVIDMSKGNVDLAEKCLEETGGLGVDIVLDAGVILYNTEDPVSKPKLLPHKHDIISLLSIGSHWVTREEDLQLDPPDSNNLFLKGASLSFLNDEIWNLSNARQGKYLHILKDVMDKLASGILRPQLDEPVPLYEAKVFMEMVQKNEVRKRQVVQL